jgi:hypothetical protein
MYECVMVEDIHESIYDICENIYDNMCYCESNFNEDNITLIQDLINFVEDRIETISKYDMNTILVWYGIDNAVASYNDHYGLNNISINEFTKSLIIFLVIQSFRMESVDELNTAPQSPQSQQSQIQ